MVGGTATSFHDIGALEFVSLSKWIPNHNVMMTGPFDP
jgi:hypothetical protein